MLYRDGANMMKKEGKPKHSIEQRTKKRGKFIIK